MSNNQYINDYVRCKAKDEESCKRGKNKKNIINSLLFKAVCVVMLSCCLSAVLSSCGERGYSVQDYLSVVGQTSGASCINQVVSVSVNQMLISEFVASIDCENAVMRVQTTSKKLNSALSATSDYTTKEECVYYADGAKYSMVDGKWSKQDNTPPNTATPLSIKQEHLSNIKLTAEKNGEQRTLSAQIKQNSLKAVFGNDFGGTSCKVSITLNSKGKLALVTITYTASENSQINMQTSYSYTPTQVLLPNIA